MKKHNIFRICYGVILCIFLLSATALLLQLTTHRQNRVFYQQLRAEEMPLPKEGQGEKQSALSLRFSETAAIYEDAVFWLQIPDTTVDYPVLLGKDNQFYLRHLPDGTENRLGSIFLDYRTTADSPHLILYGHNGANGVLFGTLKQYESPTFLAAHPSFLLATEDTVYTCSIFSVRRIAADSAEYTQAFVQEKGLAEYIAWAASCSENPIAVPLEGAARVVTLSTCTDWQSERLIVQAVLFPKAHR